MVLAQNDFEQLEYQGSTTVRNNQSNDFSPIDIARFMLNEGLHDKSPNNWTAVDREIEKLRMKNRETGVVHAAMSKEDLNNGRSLVFTSFETLERLQNNLSHWTPQTYMWGAKNNEGRTFDNMRAVSCFGIEIDEEISVNEVFYASAILGLPEPNLILQTPNSKGLQWFYVTDKPFSFSSKGRRAGKLIGHELRRAFSEVINVDNGADPLGYFRFPNNDNMRYFQSEKVNSNWLLTWAKAQTKNYKRSIVKKKNSYLVTQYGIMQDPAIKKLVSDVFIRGSRGVPGRNHASFTLALAMKYDGKSEREIIDTLDEWNTQLRSPIRHTEILKTVRSAMNDKYKAPSKSIVEELTGVEMLYRYDIRTPKVPREKRVQSHYDEWEQDIVTYIESNASDRDPYLKGSLRSLGKEIGLNSPIQKEINKDSLKDVLNGSKLLIVKSNGKRGRNALTYITTRKTIFKVNKAQFQTFLQVNKTDVPSKLTTENHETQALPNHLTMNQFDSDDPGGYT